MLAVGCCFGPLIGGLLTDIFDFATATSSFGLFLIIFGTFYLILANIL